MARIHELKINNFRGIKNFSEKFDKNFICLLGRGDSGKTTILDAISYVLSPNWNSSFYDSDFFEGNIDNSIEVEISLLDLPEKLISEDKYGLYIRGLDSNGVIQDELHNDYKKVLTIKPGITGLAQISGRSDLSFEDEVKLDAYYIENWSILFDIAILLRTPLAVLKGRKVE